VPRGSGHLHPVGAVARTGGRGWGRREDEQRERECGGEHGRPAGGRHPVILAAGDLAAHGQDLHREARDGVLIHRRTS
jgi:hypothetical protein